MSEKSVRLITIPKISDLRGNLSFIEELNHVPFKIERSYWIYDVPGGEARGGHAFKTGNEFILPLSGRFEVETIRGEEKQTFQLDSASCGLFLPNMTWRSIGKFTTNAVCLILSDTLYNENDYLRDFSEYITFYNANNGK